MNDLIGSVEPGDYLFLDGGTSGFVDDVQSAGTVDDPGGEDHGRPLVDVVLDTGDGRPTLRLFADESVRINRKTN